MVQHNAGKEGHNFGSHTVGEGEGVCGKTPLRGFYGVIRLAESLYADIEGSEEVNEEDSRDPVPTLKQALQAAQLLQQNYLDSTVGNEDDTWMILKLQEKLEKNSAQARVQTSLFDYFA